MTAPTPHDTRLFDAGASWATEPADRRGYGDALRDAVERATTPGREGRGRELAEQLVGVHAALVRLNGSDGDQPADRRELVDRADVVRIAERLRPIRHAVRALAETEAGSGIARRGLGDPYPIAQAIDGVTADLDASLSPRVDLVRVLLDVANTYVDRLIVEARTWTPAPAGPAQAEGAGETEVRRVLADRGYRGDDEPVHVLLGRVLDGLGARSTDPYGTGDGSYPEPNGGSS